MQKNYQRMRPSLLAHKYDIANDYIDSKKQSFYKKDNRLLYYMDKGMVLHLAERYAESNATLELAKTTAEDLWTESIGKNAASWLTTDNSIPYQGEDFEKILLHVVIALNYMGLNMLDEARVEARQITNDLQRYQAKYQDASNTYTDDAFARWLSGRLWQTDKSSSAYEAANHAWIEYKKALQLYTTYYPQHFRTTLPHLVISDALESLDTLGDTFKKDFIALKQQYPQVSYVSTKDSCAYGRVVFLHLNGEAPVKVDRFWSAVVGPNVLRIAYPEFIEKIPRIAYARIRLHGSNNAILSEKVQDIAAIAKQNLNDRMGRIKTKAIARAVTKFTTGAAAEVVGMNKGGGGGAAIALAGVLWNAGNAIAEEADKRSWVTLPATITAAQLYVPAGAFVLDVDYVDAMGIPLEHGELHGIVQAGETVFLSSRTYL